MYNTEKAVQGTRLLKSVFDGDSIDLESVSSDEAMQYFINIAHATHYIAEINEDSFERGSFSIADPEQKIYQFFKTLIYKINDNIKDDNPITYLEKLYNIYNYQTAYKRFSSHYISEQNFKCQFGINFANTDLPHDKETILLGYVDRAKKVFFKLEEHGTTGLLDSILHMQDFLQSVPKNIKDKSEKRIDTFLKAKMQDIIEVASNPDNMATPFTEEEVNLLSKNKVIHEVFNTIDKNLNARGKLAVNQILNIKGDSDFPDLILIEEIEGQHIAVENYSGQELTNDVMTIKDGSEFVIHKELIKKAFDSLPIVEIYQNPDVNNKFVIDSPKNEQLQVIEANNYQYSITTPLVGSRILLNHTPIDSNQLPIVSNLDQEPSKILIYQQAQNLALQYGIGIQVINQDSFFTALRQIASKTHPDKYPNNADKLKDYIQIIDLKKCLSSHQESNSGSTIEYQAIMDQLPEVPVMEYPNIIDQFQNINIWLEEINIAINGARVVNNPSLENITKIFLKFIYLWGIKTGYPAVTFLISATESAQHLNCGEYLCAFSSITKAIGFPYIYYALSKTHPVLAVVLRIGVTISILYSIFNDANKLYTELQIVSDHKNEKTATAKLETEKAEVVSLVLKKAEATKLEVKKAETDRLELEKAEATKLEVKKAETDRLELEKAEATKLEVKKAETDRLELEKAKVTKLEIKKAETDRLELEKAGATKLEVEKVETDRLELEKAESARLEAEKVGTAKLELVQSEAFKEIIMKYLDENNHYIINDNIINEIGEMIDLYS